MVDVWLLESQVIALIIINLKLNSINDTCDIFLSIVKHKLILN